MKTERVKFTGSLGGTLGGAMDWPDDGNVKAFALFAHCFTCSKDLRASSIVSRTLASQVYAVLRFDFTGLGESEGDFAETSFASNLEDLVAAAEFLAREHQAPRLLIGHSLGGTRFSSSADARERVPPNRDSALSVANGGSVGWVLIHSR